MNNAEVLATTTGKTTSPLCVEIPVTWLILAAILFTAIIVILISTRNRQDSGKCENSGNCTNEKTSKKCIRLVQQDFKYIVILFSTVLIFVAVDILIGNQDALNYISFASTITSIVLSVIAIFMTISSEAKNDGMKLAIDESIRKLEATTESLQGYAAQLGQQQELIQKILSNTDRLDEKLTDYYQLRSEEPKITGEWTPELDALFVQGVSEEQ